MRKILTEPEMITEAKSGRKNKLIIEILMFFGVFTVTSMPASIVVSVAEIANLFGSGALFDKIRGNNATNPFEILNITMELMEQIPEWILILNLFCTAFTTIMVILFCKLLQRRKHETLGMRKGGIGKEYIVGALSGLIMMAAVVGICTAFGSMSLSLSDITAKTVVILVIYFIGYIIQGMSEEVLCRGYFMVSLGRKQKIWVAILVNSVMFGLLHLFNPGMKPIAMINIILFGILASVYVIKRGNIWGACGMHSMWNFAQGNIFGIEVSGTGKSTSVFSADLAETKHIINGGSFGAEGGIGATIVLVAAIVIFLFLVPEKREKTEERI